MAESKHRMTGKEAFVFFNNWCREHGYTKKVVGDNAWRNPTTRRFARLISCRDDQVLVYEEEIGRHIIN